MSLENMSVHQLNYNSCSSSFSRGRWLFPLLRASETLSHRTVLAVAGVDRQREAPLRTCRGIAKTQYDGFETVYALRWYTKPY